MGLRLVQSAYDEALDRLTRDFRATRLPRTFTVSVDFTPSFDPAGRHQVDIAEGVDLPYYFTAQGRFGWLRTTLVLTEDADEATVHLADQLQDDVLQDLWGPVWPACTGHAHPAIPRLRDEIASWCCPASGAVLCRIGEFEP